MVKRIALAFCGLFALLIVLGWIGWRLSPAREPGRYTLPPLSEPEPTQARPASTKPKQPPVVGAAMIAVKRFLKDADSATFPASHEWTVGELRPGTWRVQGDVTAANSFNARVRQAVTVEAVEDGDNIRVVFVKIGERVAFDVRKSGGGR